MAPAELTDPTKSLKVETIDDAVFCLCERDETVNCVKNCLFKYLGHYPSYSALQADF